MIERRGYRVAGAVRASGLLRTVAAMEPDLPAVTVFDVSRPLTIPFIAREYATLKSIVAERAPILLYGARPMGEMHELADQTGAVEWVHDEKSFFTSVERLMPRITARPPSASLRLLLIDDSELTLEIMQMKLQGSGFDVRIAVSLGEVKSLVWGWMPHIIIADIKRPDVPGDQLCIQMKAAVGGDVLVVLCSSVAEKELAALAKGSSADAYVSKGRGLDRFVTDIEAISRLLVARTESGERAAERGGR
jgi:CheY-like chemotaxis protein